MPLTTDLARVRAALDRDRAWSAYAIGDLDQVRLPDCSWYMPAGDPDALVLLYRGFTPPVLFAAGDPAFFPQLFAELDAPAVSLQVLSEALAALPPIYLVTDTRPMWRMTVGAASFRPAVADAVGDVATLGPGEAPAVAALFGDGRGTAEEPLFYNPAMLAEGSFHGIWEGANLVAVAGTHLFSPALGVCAIGNVYTRRDRRGRGLAARVTSAVVRHALAAAIPTIVLNVSQLNERARHVYERLGFRVHCGFLEGDAERQHARL